MLQLLHLLQLGGRAFSPPVKRVAHSGIPVLRGWQSSPATGLWFSAFSHETGSPVTKRRRNMPSHILRRRQRPELQANRKREPLSEAAIAAQLRALIPCSTDPAWLEKMAREVESKAHQR